jgi:hypothetical protein
MTNLIDSLFEPVLTLLDNMQNRLSNIGTISAKGLDLDNYLGWFQVLGTSWIGVIGSLISGLFFIFILYSIKTNSRLYLWFKDLIKWW